MGSAHPSAHRGSHPESRGTPVETRRLVGALWIYIALYIVWAGVMIAGVTPRGVLNDFLFAPLYFAASAATWTSAARRLHQPRMARGLRCISLAWLAWGIAFLLWDLQSIAPWSALDWTARSLFTAYYPLTIIGLVNLAELPASNLRRSRLALDGLVTVIAAVTLQWYFILRFSDASLWLRAVTSTFGLSLLGELVIVCGAAVLAYRLFRPGEAVWSTLMSAGLFITVVTDFLYEHNRLVPSAWGGPAGDMLLAAAAGLVATAGLRMDPSTPKDAPRSTEVVKFGYSVLPYIAIALVAGLLIVEFWRRDVGGPVAGLIVGGGGLMALVIARLLIAQREAVDEARAREEQDARFRSLVQRSSDAILVIDSAGAIQYASPAFSDMSGADDLPVTGQLLARFVGEEAVSALLSHPETPPGQSARWCIPSASGADNVIEVTASDLRSDPAVGGIVLNLRCVSERVRLEAELRQSQKLEVVGRLASSIAHDFNNVLTVVLGNATLARARNASGARGEWDAVSQAAERGAALSRQLLSLGRPAPLVLRTLDLAEQVRRIARTLRAVLPSSLAVIVDVPDHPVPVVLDAVQVEQVLLNLALNARDAVTGGGTFTMLLTEVERGGRAPDQTGGRWACLRVTDTGSGMDEATRKQAFEPFFTTKASGLGTGLGLSTVRRIIIDAGGDVSLASAADAGTTVTLQLPLAAPRLDALRAPSEAPAPAGKGHVLVVDDEPAVREVLTKYLSGIGYRVSGASDGVEALAAMAQTGARFDLILTDLIMPRMSGQELVRALRAKGDRVPVLCMSGTPGVLDGDGTPWSDGRIILKPLALDDTAERIARELRTEDPPGRPRG